MRIPAMVWCLMASCLCLNGNASPDSQPAKQKLPKIRVIKGKRNFVTDHDRTFVPFGVTYYRPGTGWAPQVWTQFDAEATRKDFASMKRQGVNCVRVFLSYHSFYPHAGVLETKGINKFDQFLAIAEEVGIYVHPTGPDLWEGVPEGQPITIEDEETLRDLEQFWKLFAARYCGRSVIFGYDLRNEPAVEWDSPLLRKRWNSWLEKKYATKETLAAAWGGATTIEFGNAPIPSDKDALMSRQLLDYQASREDLADDWTRRQAAAIKSVDPDALVTVGLIQWSVPALLPGLVRHYSAFRPERQARFLDFMEIHFYPFARGAFEYRSDDDELANLAYLESVVREVSQPDKPTVMAEFGWYGGGRPRFDGGVHPAATEEQQARYLRRVVETSAGFVCGWLNWGFYDQPEATDCSELTGLATVSGKMKAWGITFLELSKKYGGKKLPLPRVGPRPALDWDACITSNDAANKFQRKYYDAFIADRAGKSVRP